MDAPLHLPVRPYIIAVDGPAASGKGSLAQRLAHATGLAYLDTGRLYRMVGLYAMGLGWNPDQELSTTEELQISRYASELSEDELIEMHQATHLGSEEIGRAASVVSAKPSIRAALLDIQRQFATHEYGAVLDGRDIGTVVCPNAHVKLFITASIEKRAERRWKQLQNQEKSITYTQVLTNLTERDQRDSKRAISPLIPAADAILIDTSEMDLDQAFSVAMRAITRKSSC